MDAHIGRHLRDRRANAAARPRIDRAHRNAPLFAVEDGMRRRVIRMPLDHLLERGRDPLHAQRQQDPVADEIFPALPANALEHDAGHQIHHVLVLVGAAERLAGFEMAQRGEHAAIVEMAAHMHPVVARQAGAMGQQIAQRRLLAR
ncbi:MAG TPA: hypothetical protein VHT21_20270, partial [Stellaceae bacterium]|nr:hypothetical protein [Stellaceae bacterium]